MMSRILAGVGLALALTASSGQAAADCLLRPIEGTVGFRVAQQSQRTNAQAFGAVQLAEEALFSSDETDLDGDGKPDRTEPFQGDYGVALRLNTVFNVARVPTIYSGKCFDDLTTGQRRDYGMHSVDLYATAVAYRFRIPQLRRVSLFYAGSITGSTMGVPDSDAGSWFDAVTRTRYNTTYLYGFSALPLSFLAPLAPLINKDDAPTQLAGDFIAGFEADLPTIGAARFGYAYSRGLFTNITVDRIRLLLEGLITQEFSSLALLKGGFQRFTTLDGVGRTSLYGRHMQLATPRTDDVKAASRGLFSELGLTTAHFEQTDIGKYFDIRLAYAFQPTPFIHEARVGLHGSNTLGKDYSAFDLFRVSAGIVQLPSLPFYGVEGGRAFSFELSMVLQTEDGSFQMGVQRNAPDLLVVFPYAYDATNFFIRGSVRPKTKTSTKKADPRP